MRMLRGRGHLPNWGSRLLTDEELEAHTVWPVRLPVVEIARRIATAQRFVDLDNTLIDHERACVRWTFCGRPLGEFLGQAPWILQSWNPNDAVAFVERFPHLPPPLLIIRPPSLRVPKGDLRLDEAPDSIGEENEWVFKDLFAFGITGVQIYDDFGTSGIHAPGCWVISSFDYTPFG